MLWQLVASHFIVKSTGIFRPDFTSKLVHVLAFGTPKFYIGPYDKIRRKLVNLGPVVQSIVSLTSSLRGQLVKCFTTLLPNTLKFYVEKIREAFALQKLLTFFQQKILAYLRN